MGGMDYVKLLVEHSDPLPGEPKMTEPPAGYLRVDVVAGVAQLTLLPCNEYGVEQEAAPVIGVSARSLISAVRALLADELDGDPPEWGPAWRDTVHRGASPT
jgi:hypothetical protein